MGFGAMKGSTEDEVHGQDDIFRDDFGEDLQGLERIVEVRVSGFHGFLEVVDGFEPPEPIFLRIGGSWC